MYLLPNSTLTVGQEQGIPIAPSQGVPPSEDIQAFLEAAQQASQGLTDSLSALATAHPDWAQDAPPAYQAPPQGATFAQRLAVIQNQLAQLRSSAQNVAPLVRSRIVEKAPDNLFTFIFVYLLSGALFSPMGLNEFIDITAGANASKRLWLRVGFGAGFGLLGALGTNVLWKLFFGVAPNLLPIIGGAAAYSGVATLTSWMEDQEVARWGYLALLVMIAALIPLKSQAARSRQVVQRQQGQPQRQVEQPRPQGQPGASGQPGQPGAQMPTPQGTGTIGGWVLPILVAVLVVGALGVFVIKDILPEKPAKASKKARVRSVTEGEWGLGTIVGGMLSLLLIIGIIAAIYAMLK